MNKRKDEKIQLYRKEQVELTGTTKTAYYRHFIYNEEKYYNGGLWANAREMSASEVVSTGMQQDIVNIKFQVNRNPKIKEDLKVIYRNEIYDIKAPIDQLDGRTVDIQFVAVKTTDTTKYLGDRFDE